MNGRTFTGFGFGAIQSGLFLYEAFRSGRFDRLVVAEVLPEAVRAVREAGGMYRLNVAHDDGIRTHDIAGITMLNPSVAEDREMLVQALAESSEIATALPSVDFYCRGRPAVADLLAEAINLKASSNNLPAAVIYTAENNNHAAEHLQQACGQRLAGGWPEERVQILNTVIGKMSGVVQDADHMERDRLAAVTPGSDRAFLVESFNRILISAIEIAGFERGITVFDEKPDLLPFEEAKLYGHNATHALIGYLAARRSLETMSEVGERAPDLLELARSAFLEESGQALIARYEGLDYLFTPAGYREYADDLLQRMMNPFLRDSVERVTRDPARKLGWNDRLVGTMRLALRHGIQPRRYALGAAAAMEKMHRNRQDDPWPDADPVEREKIRQLIEDAGRSLP